MSRLSVLVVHNRYRYRGGEDAVFDEETDLLERHGHRVGRLLFDNNDLPETPNLRQKLTMGAEAVWSNRARARLREAVREWRPDVVHFHNTLPQISPAAFSAARESGAAVVQTLHNFRLLCPGSMFYRDGKPCEDCLGDRLPLAAINHACYRDSRSETSAMVAMLVTHNLRGTFRHDVDIYISPSEFLKRKLLQGGYAPEQVYVKPNFVAPDPGQKRVLGDYVLYSGRLTATKGIDTLIAAYDGDDALPRLVIDGHGDMAPQVEALAGRDPRVRLQCSDSRAGVFETMSRARFLVLPSVWYENFPVTIPEAFAHGLPIVSSDIGALAGLIEHDVTGLRFRPRDSHDLAARIHEAWDAVTATRLGENARLKYVSEYTGEHNYEQLIGAYEAAIEARSRARKSATVSA